MRWNEKGLDVWALEPSQVLPLIMEIGPWEKFPLHFFLCFGQRDRFWFWNLALLKFGKFELPTPAIIYSRSSYYGIGKKSHNTIGKFPIFFFPCTCLLLPLKLKSIEFNLTNPCIVILALVVRFITRRYIGEYDPSLERIYTFHTVMDNEMVYFDILDSAGQPHVSLILSIVCWKRNINATRHFIPI